jgi:cell wall-associated NlpC family hydrolase
MGLVRLVSVLLLTGFAAGCASGGVPRPFPGAPAVEGSAAGSPAPDAAPTPAAPGSPASAVHAAAIVETALSFRGVPYRNGGSDPTGFDCSGLVQYVFSQHGVALPREVREQFRIGSEVRLAGVEPGDLIFFRTAGDGASHVGVAVGGDAFVHAPSTRGVVRVERFSAPFWASRVVGVKRLR